MHVGGRGITVAASAPTGNTRLLLGDNHRATGSGCSGPEGGSSPVMRVRLTRILVESGLFSNQCD